MANERAKRDVNRVTVLLGVTDDVSQETRELKVDPSTDRLKVNATITGTVSSDNLGTSVKYGRATSSGSAAPLGSTQTLKNGLIVQALSTNGSSVYVGDDSVDTDSGFELQPGQATSIAINDPSSVYVIGTGSVCWISSS